jgi:CheY-like chemotaxis protein
VVIIEDNDDIRDMVRAVLSLDGHEVHEAGDGESGVELALRVKPDITLVDLGLPGVDGYEVARRLKAAGHAGRLIALTGYGQAEDRRRSEEVGFQAHLVKPVDEAALLRLLRA